MSEGKKPFTGGFKTKQKTRQRAKMLWCALCAHGRVPTKGLGLLEWNPCCPWVLCWFLDVELGYHGFSLSLISESEKQ